MFFEYIFLLKFFIVCVLLSFFLFTLSFFFVFQDPDLDKLSAYECGFNPFGDMRIAFEVRFYLVGILFIIFDLELAFLIPWVMSVPKVSILGIFMLLSFVFILVIGFIYEWSRGVLDLE